MVAILSMANKAVFFDRDGTLNVDVHYLHRPKDFKWIPEAKEAIKYVNDHGYLAILVTNQSGVARGYYPEADIRHVYDWMNEQLSAVGAHLDALYYCPHHPTEGEAPYRQVCDCRKPAPGMLLDAAKELDIDLVNSYMVGDKGADMQAAKAAGVTHKILVRTGKAVTAEAQALADEVQDSLLTFAKSVPALP